MKLTGHKTESVYRRYAIVSEADLSEGLKRLATLHDRDARAVEGSRTFTVLSQFEGEAGDKASNRIAYPVETGAGGRGRTGAGPVNPRILRST